MSTLKSIINKPYGKSSQIRMSYVQARYAVAYELGQLEELEQNDGCANPLMEKMNSNCRLLMKMMNPDGILPANPFSDTEAFLQSLDPENYFVPNSKCQFESNIKECIRAICDYQTQRSSRPSVPGESSPGRANDYINLFLEETKLWFKSVLANDKLDLDDLRKRDAFYANVRNDKFEWCFPMKNGETDECNMQSVILFLHNEVQFMVTSNNMTISPIKKPAGTPAQLNRYTPASVRRISPNLSLIKSSGMKSAIGASAGKTIVEMTPSKRLFTDHPEQPSGGKRDLESQSLLERSSATKDFSDFKRLQTSDARLSLPDSVSTSSFTSQMDEEDEEERSSVWVTVQWWLMKALRYLQIIGIALVLYAAVVGVLYLTDSSTYRTVVEQQPSYFLSGVFWVELVLGVIVADWVFDRVFGGLVKNCVNGFLSRQNYQAV